MRPFLQRRGITVTETDLGERIQQLDGQPPSHIVGPAFQKTTRVPEVTGTMTPDRFPDWAAPANVDVTVVRTLLGVAESELAITTTAVLARHLVVLLDPADIVENIHLAYRRPSFTQAAYAVLLSGPAPMPERRR